MINPAYTHYEKSYKDSEWGSIGLPLGLLYVASALEEKSCQVHVVDSLASEHTRLIKNKDYTYHGIPSETLERIIKEINPDMIGISSQFTAQEENVLKTADLAKKINDSVLVIAGGANVSCRGRRLLYNNSSIDIAVTSEGERIIKEIVDFYRGKKTLENISGIMYRQGTEIKETDKSLHIKDLDEIGFPAYHLVDMEKYLTLYQSGIYSRDRDVERNISMITSRGCPFKCVFCSISQSMGRQWRAHSAEYIIRHIEKLSSNFNVKHIHFEDDNLLLKPERFLPVLDVLSKKKITWDTPNGVRVDLSINTDMLAKMKQSGCKSLTIGVESGDEYILKNVVKKRIKLPDVEEFARRSKRVNLPLRAFFVLGFPGETLETMQRTADFALHLLKTYNVEIINLIATPLFGTELYDICRKSNFIPDEITSRMLSESTVSDGYCLINTDSFSSKDVERMSKLLTAKVYRQLAVKAISHPFKSIKRVGNMYVLTRTLKRMSFWS